MLIPKWFRFVNRSGDYITYLCSCDMCHRENIKAEVTWKITSTTSTRKVIVNE